MDATSNPRPPDSSQQTKIFLDKDGVLKRINFNGTVEPLTQEQTVSYYQTHVQAEADQATFTFSVPNPSKIVADLEKSLSAAIKETKTEVAGQVAELATSLDASKNETSILVDNVQVALKDEVDTINKQIDLLGSHISEKASPTFVTNEVTKATSKVTKELSQKADKTAVATAIARVQAKIPVVPPPTIVEAGTNNVTVVQKDNRYEIHVDVPKSTTTTVYQGGGGVSEERVDQLIDAALVGFTPSGSGGSITGSYVKTLNSISGSINLIGNGGVTVTSTGSNIYISGGDGTVTTITSVDGSIGVTAISGGYDLSTISGGQGILNSKVDKAGDTMTGALKLPALIVNEDGGGNPQIQFRKDNDYVSMIRGYENGIDIVDSAGDYILKADTSGVQIYPLAGNADEIVTLDSTGKLVASGSTINDFIVMSADISADTLAQSKSYTNSVSGILEAQIVALSGRPIADWFASDSAAMSAALVSYSNSTSANALTQAHAYTDSVSATLEAQIVELSGRPIADIGRTEVAAVSSSLYSYSNSTSANAYYQALAYDAIQDNALSAALVSYSNSTSANALFQANAYTDSITAAFDGNVVHRSGNESISGAKTFVTSVGFASGSSVGFTSGSLVTFGGTFGKPFLVSGTGASGVVTFLNADKLDDMHASDLMTYSNSTSANALTQANSYTNSVSASIVSSIPVIKGSFGATIDGGGSVPTSGSMGYFIAPQDGVITGWTMIADISGSSVIDIKRLGTSLAGSELPTISSSISGRDLSLTTWTTNISANDILEFVLMSCSESTRINLSINYNKI